jgi:hypothetical protein
MFRHQNAGQNQNMKIDKRSFENLTPFRYFGTIVTNDNFIYEEIKTRIISGNATIQFKTFRLLPSAVRKVQIKVYKTIILPLVLYYSETLSLTLREEYRMRVFENRFLRRMFRPKKDEVIGDRRKLHNEDLRNLCSSPNIIGMVTCRRMRWVKHVAGKGEEEFM